MYVKIAVFCVINNVKCLCEEVIDEDNRTNRGNELEKHSSIL